MVIRDDPETDLPALLVPATIANLFSPVSKGPDGICLLGFVASKMLNRIYRIYDRICRICNRIYKIYDRIYNDYRICSNHVKQLVRPLVER